MKIYGTPSPVSISLYIRIYGLYILRMRKRINRARLLTQAQEEPNNHNGLIIESKEGNNNNNNLAIDQEIECPRCHDIMTLCSDLDRLCYVCEECTFNLSSN
jgi:hypothetical protein